ncbi:VanZ family protein [Aestuariimicrobium ganziense]|uniref:VanZ family protein n=1 Tax=Aestuariimicrobium ganziense TaxID=2773677 RepID=UPI001944B0AF|nr:VanZ family protein [Aestuariimicrobium ganziense]
MATLTLAFVVATVFHLIVLYSPSPEVDSTWPRHTDKVAHLLGFGVPVALGWTRFLSGRRWVVAAFAAHAVVSELVQSWLLGRRQGDPLDAVADLVGVALGVGVGVLVDRASGRSSKQRTGGSSAA